MRDTGIKGFFRRFKFAWQYANAGKFIVSRNRKSGMTQLKLLELYNADNFKAFITTRGGVVVDVDIVENKLTTSQRHKVITEYRKANRKPKQRTRLLLYGNDLLEGEP